MNYQSKRVSWSTEGNLGNRNLYQFLQFHAVHIAPVASSLPQAMHLVYKALEKQPVPMKLPSNVIPPSKRKKSIAIPGAIRVLPPVGLLPSPPHSSLGSVSSPPPVAIGRRSPTAVASVVSVSASFAVHYSTFYAN